MKIIVGHTNMDLDCIGSIVLARYLFPDYLPVKSRLIHPVAMNLHNMYKNHLSFLNPKELDGKNVSRIVVVDTRTSGRISEYLSHIDNDDYEVEVFDHHPADSKDIPNAIINEKSYGANTTQLGERLMALGIRVGSEDATIALSGIYADTGNFTHQNVHKKDFEVASWLIDCGADLKLVSHFLQPLKRKLQISLFHQVLNTIEYKNIQGHFVITSYTELEEESKGINAVVEKIFEVENAGVYLAFFYIKKRKKLLIVGRNQKQNIRLNEIMAEFGGGGHHQAASAIIKTENAPLVYRNLLSLLDRMFSPAYTAADLMTEEVFTLKSDMSLMDASKELENASFTGAPVVNENGRLAGFLTLRDIMKGRRADQMRAPVKAYMTRKLVTINSSSTVREIDELMLENNIGHLPVVDDDAITGIVTRHDYLNFKRGERKRRILTYERFGLLKKDATKCDEIEGLKIADSCLVSEPH
ncbi:MAG: CBS domain-containing protein [Spirochaetales bacterium]|nr:CBS domain-containing protein [Spirochaetales bacterium]